MSFVRQESPMARQRLPKTLNSEGRPVWEPPILDLSHLIGEEYDKKRESVMKYTNNNPVLTTKIMDLGAERDVLMNYTFWINVALVDVPVDEPDASYKQAFYEGLWNEVHADWNEVATEHGHLNVVHRRSKDGVWETSEAVWVTKSFELPKGGQEIKEVGPYRSAFRARVAASRQDTLPPIDILVPDELDPEFAVPTWDFEPLQVDITAPIVMGLIFNGKLEAVCGGRREYADDVQDVD